MGQILRNAKGVKIGEIQESSGKQIIRDARGVKKGEFDGKITRDSRGKKVGEGNLLSMLLDD